MFGLKKKKDFGSSGAEFLIVGLGNPGDKYEFTRHNAGFMCVDFLADKLDFKINGLKYKSLLADVDIKGHRCLIMKPQTFMNNSGEAVRDAAQFYKIPPENVIVIYDDISLDVGRIRVRRKGSDGGHNGIKSIIYHLNSDNFPRIKVGVGKKPPEWEDLADWVLSRFTNDELKTLHDVAEKVCKNLPLMLDGKIDEAMNRMNS
ncbi:MAG: aminoacyl-tRNA hydrolase [Clostridia bacterium]|nr:aminoacyl-tRNA hydrolase [Clostridia bacterium]